MGAEYERKFAATPANLAAMDAAFSEIPQTISMETTYYDTPSRTLSARRWTLRKRLENGESVCTLKTPAGKSRGEWEVLCDTIGEAIAPLIALGAPAELASFTAEGLELVCGARFTRRARQIQLPEGAVELALDEGVLLGGGKELPLCEAEVELKAGDYALCDQFAAQLAARFDLTEEPRSKFARAMELATDK